MGLIFVEHENGGWWRFHTRESFGARRGSPQTKCEKQQAKKRQVLEIKGGEKEKPGNRCCRKIKGARYGVALRRGPEIGIRAPGWHTL